MHSHVPSQWKTAIIHPIPKIESPSNPADYRPISIVPVLARMLERELVRTYMYQTFQAPPISDLLADQYAFRPNGSTTAALISILHHVTTILTEDAYVTIISLDFAKAFDTVRHSVLARKLSNLELPDCIYNWLVDFLEDRSHATRIAGRLSAFAHINASVIQGSGVGPSDFIVNASDLHPIHERNKIVKFADDTYLIIGRSMRYTISEELEAINEWATANNLRLNTNKSKEMLVARRLETSILPPLIQGMERVTEMKILGVILRGDLRATSHVERVLRSCTGSLQALRVLRAHGLSPEALSTVARATTVSRLFYASPTWWGLTSAEDRSKLERFQRKMQRLQFLSSDIEPLTMMAEAADARLMRAVSVNDAHVLRRLFPPTAQRHYNMRPRSHPFELPAKDDRNFIPRILYKIR